MRTLLRSMAFLAALLPMSPSALAAENLTDLYQVQVTVTGQSEETRAPALMRCFRDVLVKVSGDPELLTDPRLAALHDPTNVQSFRYRDQLEGLPKHDEQGTRDRPYDLTVEFNPEKINAVLRNLGREPWSAARPRVVIFMAVHIGDASYVLADQTEPGAVQRQSLQAASKRYGVPIAFPTQAALQGSSVNFETLLNPDLPALNALAISSGGDIAFAGSMTFSDEALGWIADWHLLSAGKAYRWQIRGVNFDEAFRNALRGTAQVLSGHGRPD